MAQIKKKEEARSLRKAGKTITEISLLLSANKTTVSYWCRDITLTQKQKTEIKNRLKISGLRGLSAHTERLRRNRLQKIASLTKTGFNKIGQITKRDLNMIGLALYWAEGYKKGNEEFGITNSDPDIIKIILVWLQTTHSIDKHRLILRISINRVHEKRLEQITSKWSRILGIPETQFTKPSLIKTPIKKVYGNNENYLGTLRVKVRLGTDLRREVLGSISAFRKHVEKF
ncbi:MAG: hypothetical protein WC250_03955 [Candidatus Paceibacterota bacterium]|jgi:hypothetical protein